MFNENTGLVYKCIKTLYIPPETWDDTFQEGCIGLCHAIEKYDPESGYKFSTYAFVVIRGYMLRYLRDNNLIKTSRDVVSRRNRVHYYRDKGMSDEEIMRKMKITPFELVEVDNITDVSSLDYCPPDVDSTISDIIPDTSEYVEDYYGLVNHIISLAERVAPIKHKTLCLESLYSRIYEDTPITQEELARKYGYSQPQVSRILRVFYEKLKEAYYK